MLDSSLESIGEGFLENSEQFGIKTWLKSINIFLYTVDCVLQICAMATTNDHKKAKNGVDYVH